MTERLFWFWEKGIRISCGMVLEW